MSTILFRGPGFEDCFIKLVEGGSVVMLAAISDNDEITATVEVKDYDGDPIAVLHGETQVGTISNSGVATRSFTAADNNNEVYIRPTGESQHHLGYLEVAKD